MSKIVNYTQIIYTVYIASTLCKNVFVGVGCNVTVTRKITESILFSEISRKLNTYANSVYQAFPPPLECLGTRLVMILLAAIYIYVEESQALRGDGCCITGKQII